jgi:hypothetical protein
MAGAPKGNKNNEKYDYQTAKKFFEDSLELLNNDPSILYIGTLAVRMGIYRQLYDYLLDRFIDLDTIKKRIDTILESRVVERTMNNEVNATFSIFMMKNNHGWSDKHEVDNTHNINLNTSAKAKKIIDEIGDD